MYILQYTHQSFDLSTIKEVAMTIAGLCLFASTVFFVVVGVRANKRVEYLACMRIAMPFRYIGGAPSGPEADKARERHHAQDESMQRSFRRNVALRKWCYVIATAGGVGAFFLLSLSFVRTL